MDYIAKPCMARRSWHECGFICESGIPTARWSGSIGRDWKSCAMPNRPSWCVRKIARTRASQYITSPWRKPAAISTTCFLGPIFGYFVADISGHGVSAAFLTSAVKALLRQYAGPMFSPEDTMRGVDSVMGQIWARTISDGMLRALEPADHRLTVIGAGHPPLILVKRDGTPQIVKLESDPLGMFGAAILRRQDLHVSRGDRFFIYSDGLIESSPGGGRGRVCSGLLTRVSAIGRRRLADSLSRIVRELRPKGHAADDDVLLLAADVSE